MCSVEGCDQEVYALGFCRPHYRHDYYMRHRDKAIRKSAQWRRDHPERARAWTNARRALIGRPSTAGDPQRAAYRAANAERLREYSRAYRRAHLAEAAARMRARRARRRES